MEGKSACLYKTLVVGIIILFLCVSFQPVVAIADKEQNIKVDNNENGDDLGIGFILCEVYSKLLNPGYPYWFPWKYIYMPATGTIITCKDLDTGNTRIGIAKYGLKLFKFLPIGHDYKIECFGIFNSEMRYINNLNGFVKILIMP